jgi:hypothetical protein
VETEGGGSKKDLELEMKLKISTMEEAFKVKDDIIQINEAKLNSVEMDGLQKQAKIEKFQRIFVNMTSENKRLKEEVKGNAGVEVKEKVKKLSNEIKEKNKKLEENEKRMVDMMKKLSEETNSRAKAEAEVVRANKMIDYLHEALDKKKEPLENITATDAKNHGGRNHGVPRCLDQDRRGGCTFGDTCRYIHDQGREEIRVQKTEDCGFWLEGSCRFTDKACRNIHDPKKIGTKPKQEVRRSIGVTSSSFLGQGNPVLPHSVGQQGVGAGLQLVTAGGQLYLQQGGQVIQQVQPVVGLQGGQQGIQLQGGSGIGSQGIQPGMQSVQISTQGGQFNPQQMQQGGLGGWGTQ